MKRIFSLLLALAIILSGTTFTKAASNPGTLLTEFNPISKPTLSFSLVKEYKGDKIVIYNSENTYNDSYFYKYGLVNLKGEVLLRTKYDYIELKKNGDIKVYYHKGNRVDTYDKHMIPISSEKGVKIPDSFFFPKYSNKIDENTTFSDPMYKNIIELKNNLTSEIKTISIDVLKYERGYDLCALRYCKEIKAIDCLSTQVPDSGYIPYFHLSCFDLNGYDIFENDLGIKAYAYIGDGYYFYEDNAKKGIALLPGFKEKTVQKILRKPASTKIKKIWKKKKSSSKLKLSVKKSKNTKGYLVRIYTSKKNAKKNKKALLSKSYKKTIITIRSKKLSNKKSLFVRVRPYNKLDDGIRYGNWTAIKKVK